MACYARQWCATQLSARCRPWCNLSMCWAHLDNTVSASLQSLVMSFAMASNFGCVWCTSLSSLAWPVLVPVALPFGIPILAFCCSMCHCHCLEHLHSVAFAASSCCCSVHAILISCQIASSSLHTDFLSSMASCWLLWSSNPNCWMRIFMLLNSCCFSSISDKSCW